MYLGTRLTEASVRKRFCNRRDILFIIIIKTRPYFYTYYNYILNINITLCSLDRFRGMVDVYNYIVRVVNILTFIYLEHQQQKIVTSLICDNEGLEKCIIKYYDTNMAHCTRCD